MSKNSSLFSSQIFFCIFKGIHVLVDGYNGFGGIASTITQDLHDEFQGKSIVVVPVSPPSFPGAVSITVL